LQPRIKKSTPEQTHVKRRKGCTKRGEKRRKEEHVASSSEKGKKGNTSGTKGMENSKKKGTPERGRRKKAVFDAQPEKLPSLTAAGGVDPKKKKRTKGDRGKEQKDVTNLSNG